MSAEVTRHGPSVPPESAVAVAPNDGTEIAVTRGIYVGASGDLRVLCRGDATPVTFVGLAAGVMHPMRVKRVYATGTTATGIVALY